MDNVRAMPRFDCQNCRLSRAQMFLTIGRPALSDRCRGSVLGTAAYERAQTSSRSADRTTKKGESVDAIMVSRFVNRKQDVIVKYR